MDNMRRLAMHEKLEPLFDRLGEMFTFRDPIEVVQRLELLEDDKLGALSQMVPMQEEVASLTKSLKAAQKSHAATVANSHIAHAQEMTRLCKDLADMQEELSRAEEVVRCCRLTVEERRGSVASVDEEQSCTMPVLGPEHTRDCASAVGSPQGELDEDIRISTALYGDGNTVSHVCRPVPKLCQ